MFGDKNCNEFGLYKLAQQFYFDKSKFRGNYFLQYVKNHSREPMKKWLEMIFVLIPSKYKSKHPICGIENFDYDNPDAVGQLFLQNKLKIEKVIEAGQIVESLRKGESLSKEVKDLMSTFTSNFIDAVEKNESQKIKFITEANIGEDTVDTDTISDKTYKEKIESLALTTTSKNIQIAIAQKDLLFVDTLLQNPNLKTAAAEEIINKMYLADTENKNTEYPNIFSRLVGKYPISESILLATLQKSIENKGIKTSNFNNHHIKISAIAQASTISQRIFDIIIGIIDCYKYGEMNYVSKNLFKDLDENNDLSEEMKNSLLKIKIETAQRVV